VIKGFLNNAAKPAAGTNGTRYDGHHRDAGDRHRDRKEWLEAVAGYERHLEHAPDDHAIWIQLGNVAKEAGQFDKAMGAYRRALELDPDSADLHLQIGHLQKTRRMRSLAIMAYERALEINPLLTDAASEIRVLKQQDSDLPFLEFTSFLDDVRLDNVHELIAWASIQKIAEDPFKLYANIIQSK